MAAACHLKNNLVSSYQSVMQDYSISLNSVVFYEFHQMNFAEIHHEDFYYVYSY